jgi:methylthioribose-1-phosphate isomerase
MRVGEEHYRTIWLNPDDHSEVKIIDQRWLPHKFVVESINSAQAMAGAISDMHVRGAGLIGAAAGFGIYLAVLEASKSKDFDQTLNELAQLLLNSRPTAVNLSWAVKRQLEALKGEDTLAQKIDRALLEAQTIADEDADHCRNIGQHGLQLIEEISRSKPGPVQILTHCNAGWLAFVDYGSATAPIYAAHDRGIEVHVWVDETRPRNQGARLTAWELEQHQVPYTVIADNTGGHLMQHGKVDLVLVGSDRTTYTGDVANKIGTYLKALAAKDNHVPFYVALPSSTIDWTIEDGVTGIPIEERGGEEVRFIQGLDQNESIQKVLLTPPQTKAQNYAFDVTPRHLVTGLITERGICSANAQGVFELYPEMKSNHG